uniref:Uncharacterized protein n=1 Tax=viral metagenome TaxID=1070528 RepID=A0A6M3KHE9_9ZZZZ
MSIPVRRKANPLFGGTTLAAANNGIADWIRGSTSPLDQKGSTGWLARLYGGVQTNDDWARVNVPVDEIYVPDFHVANWSWYQTDTQTMGLGIVIWVHDPNDFDKRAEITQLGGHADLPKAAGWNAFAFSSATAGMFFYGENTTGTGLTAGTQYAWSSFIADALFKNWTIYRITLDWGWEASGTFNYVYVADIKLNGVAVPVSPGDFKVTSDGIPVVALSTTPTIDIGDVTLLAGTAAIGKLAANSGVDIGDTTINNAAGAAAVNIQDGGNTITVDGTVVVDTSALATSAKQLADGHNVAVTGSVTANAGTNLNTSALATSALQLAAGHTVTLAAGTANAGVVGHNKTGVADGVVTVTTPLTDVPLVGSSTPAKVVTVQAQTDNTGAIAVGGEGVVATIATGTGIILYAGDSITLEVDDLADVWIDAIVGGEGVRFTYLT